ncbi:porin [Gluconobacter frateurii M-2]|nr:porin [Gluconobacter frateurii M-2]
MSRLHLYAAACAVSLTPAIAAAEGAATAPAPVTTVVQSGTGKTVTTVHVLAPITVMDWPDQNSENPSARVNTPLTILSFDKEQVPPLPKPEALLTNPFGWNKWLRDRGIALMMDNTNEYTGAITKPTPGYGLRQGSSNAGQYSH